MSNVYDPRLQTGHNGELSADLKQRIDAVLAASPRISLAVIARAVGLSPSFLAGLTRGGKRIRTRHMVRFDAAIQQLEGQVGAVAASAKLLDLLTEVAASLSAADRAALVRRVSAIL